MTWDGENDEWVLTTGTRFYAFSGALSVRRGRLAYGSDGSVAESSDLTADERREIADHVIAEWEVWRDHGDEP